MGRHWSQDTDWIWSPNWDEKDHVARFVQFRKTFTVETAPAQCVVHVSADTRYRLFVNGQSVAFGPAKSHLGEWNYETVDVATLLRTGGNVVAARVLRYSPFHSGNMSMTRGIIPGFILHCSDMDISTSSSWRCKVDDAVKILSTRDWNPALGPSFLSVSEDVDGSKEDRGWLGIEYNDSTWHSAIKSTMKTPMLPILDPWRLAERSIPHFPEIDTRFTSVARCDGELDAVRWHRLVQSSEAVEIPPNSQTTVVLGAASLTTAFLQFRFQGGAASRIRIRTAECFEKPSESPTPNPFARNKGNRTDVSGIIVGQDDFYTIDRNIPADFDVSYEPFWFRTFRYIELHIETSSTPLRVLQLDYRAIHYPLDIKTQISHFPSPGTAKTWEISLNTLRNCMHETYEDCPFYEQNQFAMDARLQILFTYQLSHDDRLARKCMQEFYASRRPDGLIETHFPSPFPGVNIPCFSLYWILMVHDHMMYFGDASLVRRYLGAIDGILNHFDQRLNENGLVGRFAWDVWPFVDWTREWSDPASARGDFRNLAVPPAYHRTGVATYNSLVYAYALQKAAELCAFIGRRDTGAEYRQRASNLNNAVVKNCLRGGGGGGFFVDGPDSPDEERSQHCQVFAVLSGAVGGDEARDILLRSLIDEQSEYARCSYAMGFYVFEAARKTNLYDQLRPMLLRPWSDMMSQNLTTWAESAAMPRSDCHGWSAVPVHDFVANVAGLSPGGPGFGTIRFEPRRKHWETMEGSFAIAGSGVVRISWAPGRPIAFTPDFDARVEVLGVNGSGAVYQVASGETLAIRHE